MRKMAKKDAYPLCLEIGCGRGVGASLIIEKFGAEKVIATDVDPAQIKRAEKFLRPEVRDKVDFRVEDAMALDEPNGKFDAVFSFGVIHHTEDWRKAVGEAARVLKPGGEFFFMEPLRAFVRLFEGGLLRAIAKHPPGGEFGIGELRERLFEAGFEAVEIRRIARLIAIGAGRKPLDKTTY